MQPAEPTIDVELIFSVSPPVASRPGRLAASRRCAAISAAIAAGMAGLVALMMVSLLCVCSGAGKGASPPPRVYGPPPVVLRGENRACGAGGPFPRTHTNPNS